ncbi:MAG: hypothetical protein HC880_14155 [Bacteroidia bacterium]|nr:hypothetical protein [Bacteroidia bacterium]
MAERSPAEKIIDQAVEAHGGKRYQHARIDFDFRGTHYQYFQDGGQYRYQRSFSDSLGNPIQDILSNEGFVRQQNGKPVAVSEEWKTRYSNSINSVIYFVMLPFKLQDPAVQAEYLGKTTLNGQAYDKVKVSFLAEGGGDDYSDKYIYWIHRDKKTLDYLAYSYEVEEGGTRFREAFNPQVIEGIRFADYNNYAGKKDTPVEEMDQLFEAGKLEKLSEIITENIQVELLKQ